MAYSDADFVLKPDKRFGVAETNEKRRGCSTTGWVILLAGAAVAWKSGKQTSPSDSVCEAEYRAALDASKEIVWLRCLMEELLEPQPAVPLYIDNDACQKLIEGESTRGETKHLVRQFLILMAMVKDGEINPEHIGSTQQVADFLTKVTTPKQFETCRRGCGLVELTDETISPNHTNDERVQESAVWLQRQGERAYEMEEEEDSWAEAPYGDCSISSRGSVEDG